MKYQIGIFENINGKWVAVYVSKFIPYNLYFVEIPKRRVMFHDRQIFFNEIFKKGDDEKAEFVFKTVGNDFKMYAHNMNYRIDDIKYTLEKIKPKVVDEGCNYKSRTNEVKYYIFAEKVNWLTNPPLKLIGGIILEFYYRKNICSYYKP